METLSISKFNRSFLLMDLLLCSLWALFVFRIWSGNVMTAFCVRENLIDWWAVPFVLYAVALRLSVSIMMYHNDKHGLWASLLLVPASIVSVLLSRYALMDAIPNVIQYINLAGGEFLNPAMRWFGLLTGLKSYEEVINYTWSVFLFCWIWLLPFVYFLIRRKKCVTDEHSLTTALFGIYIFKDADGKKYLKICALVLIAVTVGRFMNSIVSLIGLVVLSYVFYLLLARREKNTFTAYKWFFAFLAVIAVWLAQYQIGMIKILLLSASVLLSFLMAIIITKGKREPLKWLLVTVVAGIILPSVCLGYTVFSNNNVKRLDLLEAKYNLTGVMKVQDSLGNIGLRDRYRMIIPAEYSDIQDYELPYLKVKKGDYWGIWNTQYAGFVKGNYDYAIIGYDIKPYEDMCFHVKPEYAFLEPMEDITKFRYRRELNDTISYGELISE